MSYHEIYMDSVSNHDPRCMVQRYHPKSQRHCKQTQLLDLDMLYLKVEDTWDLLNHLSQPQLIHHQFPYEKRDVYVTPHSLMYYLFRI